jgi:hypothetical protein
VSVISIILVLVGVVGMIAGILSLSAWAERWIPPDDRYSSVETNERPLVRIIKSGDRGRREEHVEIDADPGLTVQEG